MRATHYGPNLDTFTDADTGKTITPWVDTASGFRLTTEEVAARGLPERPADDAPTTPHPYGDRFPHVVMVPAPDVVRMAVTLRHDAGMVTLVVPVIRPTSEKDARERAITAVCAAEGAPHRSVWSIRRADD